MHRGNGRQRKGEGPVMRVMWFRWRFVQVLDLSSCAAVPPAWARSDCMILDSAPEIAVIPISESQVVFWKVWVILGFSLNV